eukprot:167091_1
MNPMVCTRIYHMYHTIRNTTKQNDNRSEYLFIDNIILIITKYALGYGANCCNRLYGSCDIEIVIENQFDLIHDAASYTYYEVNKKLISNRNNFEVVEMYNKYYRFSCGVCNVNECTREECFSEDTKYYICLNHPLCCVCDNYFALNNKGINDNNNECKICNGFMCNNCAFKEERQCKNCLTSYDFKRLKTAVIDAIHMNKYKCYKDIINLIMDFSVGYILNCCNYNKCENEIVFNDRFALNNYDLCYIIDPKYVNNTNINKLLYLDGKYMRFSCGLCGINSCNNGQRGFIYNTSNICSNIDAEQDICFNHWSCELCQSRKFMLNIGGDQTNGVVGGVACDQCNRIFCDQCGIKITSLPTIKRTILCNQCMFSPNGGKRLLMNLLPIPTQNINAINAINTINTIQYHPNTPIFPYFLQMPTFPSNP